MDRTTNFVDLDRRFRALTEQEMPDSDFFDALAPDESSFSIGWDAVVQMPCVVLLAEAGSGKTVEMQEQAKRLRTEGRPAFVLPIERLSSESLADILSSDEEADFAEWQHGAASAWFFLDAVDELKLTGGRFDRALQRFAKAVNGHLDRAHVIISCRPSDWRPEVDLERVRTILPVPKDPEAPKLNPEEAFLAPLRRGGRSHDKMRENGSASRPDVQTVAMLPLDTHRIKRLCDHLGIDDPKAFLDEIDRHNAWTFARRPLDLNEIAALWKAHRRLGTRVQQHETSIVARLKDDPERPDRGQLEDQRAKDGAERLALALALTKTWTIRAPEQAMNDDRATSALRAAEILNDWTEEQRQTLLRRALFDPATYGRVRFHHRSVQEYLAACRLHALRQKGMSVKALFRLMFAEKYGTPVVLPSMRPIAAWLALWDADVRRELMRREPETLLTEGDPGSLDLEDRRTLLHQFVDSYGSGGWRGLRVPIDQVSRLAAPELAADVRALWDKAPTNEEVRELLLRIIWQGRLKDCVDLASAAARNPALSEREREAAVTAVVACDGKGAAREVAESMLTCPEAWPARLVFPAAAELFPGIISVDELMTLVQRTEEPSAIGDGFAWWGRVIAGEIEPWSTEAVDLRNGLANLICRNGRWKEPECKFLSKYDYLVPVLAILCHRQLSAQPELADTELFWSCVVARRFGSDFASSKRDEISELENHFVIYLPFRESAFWADVELHERLEVSDPFKTSPMDDGLIKELGSSDRAWLSKAVADATKPQRRATALEALLRFAIVGDHPGELAKLRQAVADAPALIAMLDQCRPLPNSRAEEWRQEREARLRKAAEKEDQRLSGWHCWREALLADPDRAFAPSHTTDTMINIVEWLKQNSRDRSHYTVWDRDALMQAFTPDIVKQAATALRCYWRAHPPQLWSQRPEQERNVVLQCWFWGLSGVAAEAETPGWAWKLSAEEAQTAAAWATIELNGFPAWIDDLVEAHPHAVEEVLGAELAAELAVGDRYRHLNILSAVRHDADVGLKRLLAPRLRTFLATFQPPSDRDAASNWTYRHLPLVLDLLEETSNAEERCQLADMCQAQIGADPAGPASPLWLRTLFRLDPERGITTLEQNLLERDEVGRAAHAEAVFASLSGGWSGRYVTVEGEASTKAAVLGRLVRLAYTHVRPADDRRHDGAYTPDTRDHAESARGWYLNALIDTPGAAAYQILLELADDPLFAHAADRLRMLAQERAAKDAEFAPLTPDKVRDLDQRLEATPTDRDGLFALMMDRLHDLQHDLAHDEFSVRRTLQTITQEIEMQRALARQLRQMAKGIYTVAREPEVADRKEPDIRLTVSNELQAAVEIKIADSWSLAKLETALRDQLVGQYLRHRACQVGCLLLTYRGEQSNWKHPKSRALIEFAAVVKHLRAIARDIERQHLHEIRLAVFGIDLTD